MKTIKISKSFAGTIDNKNVSFVSGKTVTVDDNIANTILIWGFAQLVESATKIVTKMDVSPAVKLATPAVKIAQPAKSSKK